MGWKYMQDRRKERGCRLWQRFSFRCHAAVQGAAGYLVPTRYQPAILLHKEHKALKHRGEGSSYDPQLCAGAGPTRVRTQTCRSRSCSSSNQDGFVGLWKSGKSTHRENVQSILHLPQRTASPPGHCATNNKHISLKSFSPNFPIPSLLPNHAKL